MDEPRVALDGRAHRALALMGLALVALAAAAGFYLHATIRSRPPAPQPAMTAMNWLSSDVGWVVLTDAQTQSVLFHTVDGGRHWERQFATVGSAISVRFLDATHGLMTEPTPFPGSNPTLLRSDDAGAHWAPITLPFFIGPRPNLPYFLDLDHGWVMVRTGRSDTAEDADIYRTADGGLNWTDVAGVDPIAWVSHGLQEAGLKRWLSFRSPSDGWLGTLEPDGSAGVYVTHDGGDDWQLVLLAGPPGGWPPGDDLMIVPPEVAEGGDGALLVVDLTRLGALRRQHAPASAGPVAVVYSTTNGGDTWSDPRPTPPAADPLAADPVFVGGTSGWSAGGDSVWLTSDAGRTWARSGRLPGRSFMAVAPVDGDVAVAQTTAGARWSLALTEDAGRSWRSLPSPSLS